MPELQNDFSNSELDAHYSNQATVAKPRKVVVNAPNKIPSYHLYSDAEAQKTIRGINTDIFTRTEEEKKKKEFNKPLLAKIIGGTLIAGIGFALIGKFCKFFRKS